VPARDEHLPTFASRQFTSASQPNRRRIGADSASSACRSSYRASLVLLDSPCAKGPRLSYQQELSSTLTVPDA
jgi:hypothetical protein